MYLWLLKIDYASTFMEYHSNISPQKNRRFGRMVSTKVFNRKKNFHGRVLKYFCINGDLEGLELNEFSLIHLDVQGNDLSFSKALALNRIVVSWNRIAFRLSLDDGKEERALYESGEKVIPPDLVTRFFNSDDLSITNNAITFPVLRRGRQKTVVAKPRVLSPGDQILLVRAAKISDTAFEMFGHIFENGEICGEENSILLRVKREFQTEKMYLDEIEIHQPGLRKLTRTAAGILDYSEDLGMEKEIITPQREIGMLLFIVSETMKIKFSINPTADLPFLEIP